MRYVPFLAVLVLVAGCQSPSAEVSATSTPLSAPPEQMAEPTAAPRALTLILDPIPARQGGQIRVSGRGFDALEPVALSVSKENNGPAGMSLGQTSASAQGTIDGITLNLSEDLASGPHAIEAVGQTSGQRSRATLWIRAREPWLVLSTYDVQPLADLGFISGGFEPQEIVHVSLAGAPNTVDLVDQATDQAGNSEWTQTKLPLVPPGRYAVVLRGEASGLELHRELQIMPLKPNAELSPWAGPPGIPVQLNARGFAPNERVHVAFGGPTVEAAVLQADADGNLWGAGPVRVPPTALAGPLVVLLTGDVSGAQAAPSFTVLETKPWLELTSWWGAPGVQVGFGGGGWIGGERVTLHVGSAGTPAAAESQADDYGWLHTSSLAVVPLDADRDVTFVAVGEQSHATASAVYKVVFPFDLRPRRTNNAP